MAKVEDLAQQAVDWRINYNNTNQLLSASEGLFVLCWATIIEPCGWLVVVVNAGNSYLWDKALSSTVTP